MIASARRKLARREVAALGSSRCLSTSTSNKPDSKNAAVAAELAQRVAPTLLNKNEGSGAPAVARRGGMPLPVGAIYGKGQHTAEQKAVIDAKVFRNVDGERHDDGRYAQFRREAEKFIPPERIITDAVRTFAYGTDASFYRMIPNTVVKVRSLSHGKQWQTDPF